MAHYHHNLTIFSVKLFLIFRNPRITCKRRYYLFYLYLSNVCRIKFENENLHRNVSLKIRNIFEIKYYIKRRIQKFQKI